MMNSKISIYLSIVLASALVLASQATAENPKSAFSGIQDVRGGIFSDEPQDTELEDNAIAEEDSWGTEASEEVPEAANGPSMEQMKEKSTSAQKAKIRSHASSIIEQTRTIIRQKKMLPIDPPVEATEIAESNANTRTNSTTTNQRAVTGIKNFFGKTTSKDSPVVLSLVVATEPKAHFQSETSKWFSAVNSRKVSMGNILLVSTSGKIAPYINEYLEKLIKRYDVGPYAIEYTDKAPNHLKVQHSPAWVVRTYGTDHVFEGNGFNPNALFDSFGQLKPPTPHHAAKNKGENVSGI